MITGVISGQIKYINSARTADPLPKVTAHPPWPSTEPCSGPVRSLLLCADSVVERLEHHLQMTSYALACVMQNMHNT